MSSTRGKDTGWKTFREVLWEDRCSNRFMWRQSTRGRWAKDSCFTACWLACEEGEEGRGEVSGMTRGELLSGV